MHPLWEHVIIEQDFEANMQIVWNAITDINQMRQWFFGNIESFNRK